MLTIIIALIAGAAIGYPSWLNWGYGWGVSCGILGFAVVQLIIGLILRKKVNAINAGIQTTMAASAEKINRKVKMFQSRPGGNVKAIQKTLEKDQNAALQLALNETSALVPLFKWNFLLKKQVDTMRMMLHYQMKQFAEVDKLMPSCMMMDPRALAMKMARQYVNKDSALDKMFAKKIKKFKGDDCALLYGLYTWILVKQDRVDVAVKALVEAKKKTDHAVILSNWEALANDKVKQFSNAGFGDEWYALHLEQPRVKQQKMRRSYR
jgi:hypothetical protein